MLFLYKDFWPHSAWLLLILKLLLALGIFFAFKSSSTFIPKLCSAVLRWMPAGNTQRLALWTVPKLTLGDVIWLISYFPHPKKKLSQTQFTIWYLHEKANSITYLLHVKMPRTQSWYNSYLDFILKFTGHRSWKRRWREGLLYIFSN